MSKVIDLDEKEKEEVILFLASALICNKDTAFLKTISKKVIKILTQFSDLALIEKIKSEGGEKIGTGTRLKNN